MVARAQEVTHATQAVHYATPTMPLNYHCTFYMRVLFREGGGARGKGGGREKSRLQKLAGLEPKWQQAQDLEALKDQNLYETLI